MIPLPAVFRLARLAALAALWRWSWDAEMLRWMVGGDLWDLGGGFGILGGGGGGEGWMRGFFRGVLGWRDGLGGGFKVAVLGLLMG